MEADRNWIETILNTEKSYKILLAQREERAQYSLDILQTLYDHLHITQKLRSKVFSAILRVSKASGMYPNCLALNDVTKVGKHPVAAGGFGEIWKGLIEDQPACLKVIRIYGDSDVQKLLKEFLKEAILWRQLNHPNVLPFLGLYFLDSSKQRACLISPWMKNGNMRQYLQNDCVEPATRFLLAYDIACGLSYLHRENVVHGDLKGENILITDAGRASIADFGLSRIVNSNTLDWSLSTSNHGKGGSARWLAPECLIQAERCTYGSDVYAFGGVCYEVFTGLVPFYELSHDAAIVFQLIAGKRPSRPMETLPLNDAVWMILEECWRQEPSVRPVANLLPSQISFASNQVMDLADDWDNSLSSPLWKSIQRTGHLASSRTQLHDILLGLQYSLQSNVSYASCEQHTVSSESILDSEAPCLSITQAILQRKQLTKDLRAIREEETGFVDTRQFQRYHSDFMFRPGKWTDMSFLDESRRLVHHGRILRQPEDGHIGMTDVYAFVFEDYFIVTDLENGHSIVTYQVNYPPIPIDLMTRINVSLPPTQQATALKLLQGLREGQGPSNHSPGSASSEKDSRLIYPITLHHSRRKGELCILYARSEEERTEWKYKLEETLTARKLVQHSERVFEMKVLNAEDFSVSSNAENASRSFLASKQEHLLTGEITCSILFGVFYLDLCLVLTISFQKLQTVVNE